MSAEALRTLDALLRNAAAGTPPFPANSRDHGTGVAVHVRPDGRTVAHLQRRVVPPPERFATIAEHAVREGERPDHLAARHFGDPELFWRLADANGVLWPDELVETLGRRVRITLPEGLPGSPHA